MTLQKFIKRLNWRHVALHFIATLFFVYSFQTFAFLSMSTVVNIVRDNGKDSIYQALIEKKLYPVDLTLFSLWINFAPLIGLLVGFIISLSISIKRKWFWFNSFLVLVLVYILGRFNQLGWHYLKNIFLTPGQIFKNVKLEFFTNGFILLTLGLLIFFLPKTNKFIAAGNSTFE